MNLHHCLPSTNLLVLRLVFVFGLFISLIIPHFGMTALAGTPVMTMHQVIKMQGKMSDGGKVHGSVDTALCTTACAVTDRVEPFIQLVHLRKFAVAIWTIDADPLYPSYNPDPALRPPDTAPIA